MRITYVMVAIVLVTAGCAGENDRADADSPTSSHTSDASETAPAPGTATASGSSSAVMPLVDGPIEPGRYRYVLGDWNTCDVRLGCPRKDQPRRVPDIDVTVPAGWLAASRYHLIQPLTRSGTSGPDGAGLALGWTNFWAALSSEPCVPRGAGGEGHQLPDIPVGPTIDDFVDAVVAHPGLDVSDPRDVELGGYPGRFFSLVGPSDISACEAWRPWEPGFYVQGPDNAWDVWVVDVDGFRVVIVAQSFPDTPPMIKQQLREMAESIGFVP